MVPWPSYECVCLCVCLSHSSCTTALSPAASLECIWNFRRNTPPKKKNWKFFLKNIYILDLKYSRNCGVSFWFRYPEYFPFQSWPSLGRGGKEESIFSMLSSVNPIPCTFPAVARSSVWSRKKFGAESTVIFKLHQLSNGVNGLAVESTGYGHYMVAQLPVEPWGVWSCVMCFLCQADPPH